MSAVEDRLFLGIAQDQLMSYAISQYGGYEQTSHLRALAKKLEAVERGDTRRLMIFMPPRHGKTMLASEYFPAWYLGKHPERFVIAATYSQERANDIGRKVRNQIADPLHGEIFPECGISPDSAAAHRFNTTRGGAYYGVGIGGPMAGRGAHLLLIDDPIKNREEAESETLRRKMKDWFQSDAYTRLMPGGSIVLIQTRWHEDDLAGWLLNNEDSREGWDVLCLPAVAEQNDSLGRQEDAALWPGAFPRDRLDEIKLAIGSRDWSALYQQRPAPREGSIFKYEWFQRYREPPAKFDRIVISLDTAYKAQQINDPSAGTVWGETANAYYLLYVWRARLEYPALKYHVKALAERWKPDAVLIEDKASGQSLIQELRLETRLPVIAAQPEGDKITRANSVSSMFEARKVFLPHSAPWLIDYETELMTFPNAANDDQVDSTTQFLSWAKAAKLNKPVTLNLRM